MNKKNAEEKSRREVAKKVVTPTRLYFVPERGELKARDLADVERIVKKDREVEENVNS